MLCAKKNLLHLAASACVLISLGAAAAHAELVEKLAYESRPDFGPNQDIYVIDVDGSNPIGIGNPAGDDGNARWSPDATKIAFDSRDSADASIDVYVVDPYGGNLTQLTDTPGHDLEPDWSPSGSVIAFSSDRSGRYEIYVMDENGGRPGYDPEDDVPNVPYLLTDLGDPDKLSPFSVYPKWSPDGKRIVFMAFYETKNNAEGYESRIFVLFDVMGAVEADRFPARFQIASDYAQEPEWSPDGSAIVYFACPPPEWICTVYTFGFVGFNRRSLTDPAVSSSDPAWSPDGQKIVFSAEGDIYTMNADGTSKLPLTTDGNDNTDPAFSPDGLQISYDCSRNGAREICLMNADGTGQSNLTASSTRDTDATWSPVPIPAPEPSIPLSMAAAVMSLAGLRRRRR